MAIRYCSNEERKTAYRAHLGGKPIRNLIRNERESIFFSYNFSVKFGHVNIRFNNISMPFNNIFRYTSIKITIEIKPNAIHREKMTNHSICSKGRGLFRLNEQYLRTSPVDTRRSGFGSIRGVPYKRRKRWRKIHSVVCLIAINDKRRRNFLSTRRPESLCCANVGKQSIWKSADSFSPWKSWRSY